VMDTGVLLIEFTPASLPPRVVSKEELKVLVARSKSFVARVDAVLETDFKRALRIVKATPTTLLILSDAAVTGIRHTSAKDSSDVLLIQLAVDVVRRLCPDYGMIGRAVADSGPIVGVLLGTSSISFEFTGPVTARVRSLVQAAPWGGCFVTHRLLRYSGVLPSACPFIKTPSGIHADIVSNGEYWRVRGMPKVSVAVVQ
jgi:hypothetical protein